MEPRLLVDAYSPRARFLELSSVLKTSSRIDIDPQCFFLQPEAPRSFEADQFERRDGDEIWRVGCGGFDVETNVGRLHVHRMRPLRFGVSRKPHRQAALTPEDHGRHKTAHDGKSSDARSRNA